MDINFIKEIMNLSDSHEKINTLSDLAIWFERGSIKKTEIVPIVNLLIEKVIYENDLEVREEAFNAMINALWFNECDRSKVNWQLLISNLNKFDDKDLEAIMIFLGASHDIKFVPILNKYIFHSNPFVRASAGEAIEEIEFNNK